MKLFYITCMFLFIATKMFGQVSHVTASATIVTPVGAEFSRDMNGENIVKNSSVTIADDKTKNFLKEDHFAFIKIIGETFSHHTTVERDDVILKRKENGETLPPGKKSFVRITVNFD